MNINIKDSVSQGTVSLCSKIPTIEYTLLDRDGLLIDTLFYKNIVTYPETYLRSIKISLITNSYEHETWSMCLQRAVGVVYFFSQISH